MGEHILASMGVEKLGVYAYMIDRCNTFCLAISQ